MNGVLAEKMAFKFAGSAVCARCCRRPKRDDHVQDYSGIGSVVLFFGGLTTSIPRSRRNSILLDHCSKINSVKVVRSDDSHKSLLDPFPWELQNDRQKSCNTQEQHRAHKTPIELRSKLP